MALSNWVSFALYTDEPRDAIHSRSFGDDTSFVADSIEVEVYKNWVYIRHPEAWFDGNGYTEPTIAKIQHGEMKYGPLRITVERGPQNGVYALIETGYSHNNTYRAMAAVGAYEPDKWSFDGLSSDARRHFAEFLDQNGLEVTDFDYTGCPDEDGYPRIEDIQSMLAPARTL